MFPYRYLPCGFVGCLIASPVAAQTMSLSVEEAVRIAVSNSPRIAGASSDVRAAQHGVSAASALTNPQWFLAPSVTGGVGGGSDTELFFSQPLELNGTRTLRKAGARFRQQGVEATAVATRRAVVYGVRVAYYELVRARSQASLTRDLLGSAEEIDRLARRQVELGSRPAVDQVQTGIEVTRARQQVTLARASVQGREAALNALLNRPQGTAIGTVSLPDLNVIPLTAPEEAIPLAVQQRSEIAINQASANESRQEGRLARAEGIPDLTPQYRANSLTRSGQGGGFGLALTLPLLDQGSRRGRIRVAEETARAAEQRVIATRLQVEGEAGQAVAEAQGAQAVLRSFAPTDQGGQNLLADSAYLLRVVRIGYEEGKTAIVSLIEAQRTFRQVQSEYIHAQVAYALALAELDRAMGRPQ